MLGGLCRVAGAGGHSADSHVAVADFRTETELPRDGERLVASLASESRLASSD